MLEIASCKEAWLQCQSARHLIIMMMISICRRALANTLAYRPIIPPLSLKLCLVPILGKPLLGLQVSIIYLFIFSSRSYFLTERQFPFVPHRILIHMFVIFTTGTWGLPDNWILHISACHSLNYHSTFHSSLKLYIHINIIISILNIVEIKEI